MKIYINTVLKKSFLTVQDDFGKTIDVIWRKICLRVKIEKSGADYTFLSSLH
jgi:hypothetical protein